MSDGTITINVLYFGHIRERCANLHKEEIELTSPAKVADLVKEIVGRHPSAGPYTGHVRMAVNEEFAPKSTVLHDGDTVALIPPVAGGSGPYCRLTDQVLDVTEVMSAVSGPGQGGTVVFIGNVRNHNDGHEVESLHYEAYDSMVLRTFHSIVERCEAHADGVRVAIAHRVGDLQIGDAAVVIAASAPHRAEAFEAARVAIELLKEETPIWKKELSPSGAEWIGSRP